MYVLVEYSTVSLLGIFATAILPIIAIAGVGFVLGYYMEIRVDPLNTISIYVLVPALIFHSLVTTELGGDELIGITLGVFIFTVIMTVLSGGVGRELGETEPLLGALILVSVFTNSGNLGIPVSEFAFGEVGRATAVVYMIAQNILMYTLGVYIAVRGEKSDWQTGVKTIFTIPLVYAVAAALLARWTNILPPADSAAMETLQLVGDSAIPVMLLILGIKLAYTDYGSALLYISPGVILKMLIAPVMGIAIVWIIGFEHSTVARVFVLQCAMPAAVTTLILTGEFSTSEEQIEAEQYVSTTIFVTTLLSVPILTILIVILQSGIVL